MKTLKVAIITNYWANSPGGGVKTYLLNFVSELKRLDSVDVDVVFRQGEDKYNYKVEGIKFLFPFKVFLVLKKINPQVIHTYSTWYCLLAGVIYKRMYRRKLYFTYLSNPPKKMSLFSKLFLQTLISECDCVVFTSNDTLAEIEKNPGIKHKKAEVIRSGIRPKEISKSEVDRFKAEFQIYKKSPILLVQSFTADKLKAEGSRLVIKAIKILRYKYPDILLILTREGAYSNELKQFAKEEGVYDNLLFTGNVDNPYVPLAICDIFVFPWLGVGNVSMAMLEAMVMQKPIIAIETYSGEISEPITNGQNGLLALPTEEEIANKIDYLINNKNISKKLGENAKKTAEERFTWDQSMNKYMSVYKD